MKRPKCVRLITRILDLEILLPEKQLSWMVGKLMLKIFEECCKDVERKDVVMFVLSTCLVEMECSRCCDGKGCKKEYHLKCLDPPPGDWRCVLCVKKIQSGVFLPGGVADSEGMGTTNNNVCNDNDSNDSVEKLKEKPVRVLETQIPSLSNTFQMWSLSSIELSYF